MAWCDVVEPRTLRECRIALGQSQAAFAAMLGASPESYRTWDAGRRATPLKILARAKALATHRDDHALLPLPVLALLIGVHVKTLRSAARDGRLLVTYDTRTTFRRLRARATPPRPGRFGGRTIGGWSAQMIVGHGVQNQSGLRVSPREDRRSNCLLRHLVRLPAAAGRSCNTAAKNLDCVGYHGLESPNLALTPGDPKLSEPPEWQLESVRRAALRPITDDR